MNTSEYAFTDSGHEQRRLARQAELFDPLTERVFRAAGVLERTNAATRMGLALYPTFVAAGLPAPELLLECWAGDGRDGAWAWANVMRGVLPLMEQFGITTAAELAPDTLADRLQDELRAPNGIVISPPMMGAWARLTK